MLADFQGEFSRKTNNFTTTDEIVKSRPNQGWT